MANEANKDMTIFQNEFKPDRMLLIGRSGMEIETFLKLPPEKLF